LNNQVLDLWSAILRAAPNARLLVFRHTLQGRAREHLSRRFMERGIDLGRIDFLCSPLDDQGYLGMYAKVDVSLDTFPWCGHTTACESLWMGAPVITLRGSRHASRMVASVLTMAGLPEWVADSKEQYIDLAVRWTKDLESLVALRTGLRDRLARSSLCDGKGFTRSLEAAYRKIWQHCCSEKNRLLPQQGVAAGPHLP
jgi:predicted O-linked N-acetylglucosamine transferase (SPINDLY family)